MPYAQTNDGRIYYKDWGQGPSVVLVHGWPLNADSFDDLSLKLVESGFRVVAYDRRGFGRSDQPGTGYDYDTMADDLAAVIAETGVERPVIAGFSMGGGEIARYLSRHGAAGVRGAVLMSAVTPYLLKDDTNPDGVDPAELESMEQDLRKDRPAFLQSFAKQFYAGGLLHKGPSDAMLDATFQMAMMAGQLPTVRCMQAFAKTDFRPDMAAFTCPTLIIHGTGDKIVPIDATGRAAAKAVPAAKLVELDGAPHGLLATDLDAAAEALIGWLKGL